MIIAQNVAIDDNICSLILGGLSTTNWTSIDFYWDDLRKKCIRKSSRNKYLFAIVPIQPNNKAPQLFTQDPLLLQEWPSDNHFSIFRPFTRPTFQWSPFAAQSQQSRITGGHTALALCIRCQPTNTLYTTLPAHTDASWARAPPTRPCAYQSYTL